MERLVWSQQSLGLFMESKFCMKDFLVSEQA